MIYEIRDASEMAEKLNKCIVNGNDTTFLETYDILAPTTGRDMIFGPKYAYTSSGYYSSNYYYGTGTYSATTKGVWYTQSTNGALTAITPNSILDGRAANVKGNTSEGTVTYILVGDSKYYIAK